MSVKIEQIYAREILNSRGKPTVEVEMTCTNGLTVAASVPKVNQIGTVSEALKTAAMAKNNRFEITASLRSGETNDTFQADLAVAVGAKQMKLGSPVRGERNGKYNRLMRIEDDLMSAVI